MKKRKMQLRQQRRQGRGGSSRYDGDWGRCGLFHCKGVDNIDGVIGGIYPRSPYCKPDSKWTDCTTSEMCMTT